MASKPKPGGQCDGCRKQSATIETLRRENVRLKSECGEAQVYGRQLTNVVEAVEKEMGIDQPISTADFLARIRNMVWAENYVEAFVQKLKDKLCESSGDSEALILARVDALLETERHHNQLTEDARGDAFERDLHD